jgi:hypothetical protein
MSKRKVYLGKQAVNERVMQLKAGTYTFLWK